MRRLAIVCGAFAVAGCVSPTPYEWELGAARTLIFQEEGASDYEVARAPVSPAAALFRPLSSPTQFYLFAQTLEELGLAEGPLAQAVAGRPRRRLPPPAKVLECRQGSLRCAELSAFRALPEVPEGCPDLTSRTTFFLPTMQRAVVAQRLDAERVLIGVRVVEDSQRFFVVSRAGTIEPLSLPLGPGFLLRTGFSAGQLLWVFDNTQVALLRVADGQLTLLEPPRPTGCPPFAGDLSIDGDPQSSAAAPVIYLQDESHALYRYTGSSCERVSQGDAAGSLRKSSVAFDPEGAYFATSAPTLRFYSTRTGTTSAALEVGSEDVVSVVRRLPSGGVVAAASTGDDLLQRPFRLYSRAKGETRFAPLSTASAPSTRWLESLEAFRGGLVMGGNPATITYLVAPDYCPEVEAGTGNIQTILELDPTTLFITGLAPTISSNAVVSFLRLKP